MEDVFCFFCKGANSFLWFNLYRKGTFLTTKWWPIEIGPFPLIESPIHQQKQYDWCTRPRKTGFRVGLPKSHYNHSGGSIEYGTNGSILVHSVSIDGGTSILSCLFTPGWLENVGNIGNMNESYWSKHAQNVIHMVLLSYLYNYPTISEKRKNHFEMRNWRNTSSIRPIFVPLNANIPGIPTVEHVITTRLVPNFSSPLGKPPYPPNSGLLWNEPRPKTKRGKNGFHDYPIALPGSCFFRKATKTHTTKQSILKYTFAWCMLFFWLWYKSKTGNCVFVFKAKFEFGLLIWLEVLLKYCDYMFACVGKHLQNLEYTEFPEKKHNF